MVVNVCGEGLFFHAGCEPSISDKSDLTADKITTAGKAHLGDHSTIRNYALRSEGASWRSLGADRSKGESKRSRCPAGMEPLGDEPSCYEDAYVELPTIPQ
jgi:hypothetical protein